MTEKENPEADRVERSHEIIAHPTTSDQEKEIAKAYLDGWNDCFVEQMNYARSEKVIKLAMGVQELAEGIKEHLNGNGKHKG